MKNYTITVNGNVYDVTVEEGTGSGAPAAAPKAASGAAGSVKVTASCPGKVFKVEAKVGQALKAGDAIIILEAMKMEIPVVAPQDGTLASLEVAVGDAVENGAVLATLN
ncbi:MAG: biotin/lipoyl-containing protein [Lachnospiraceae bacterium]|nr:biotin/lipoyl-containing protein [Lachnospiraceae bacterium]